MEKIPFDHAPRPEEDRRSVLCAVVEARIRAAEEARADRFFDADLFRDAIASLDDEFYSADTMTQQAILVNRFFDSTGKLRADGTTNFIERFVTNTLRYGEDEWWPLVGLERWGNIGETFCNDRFVSATRPDIQQYGSSLLLEVYPGEFVALRDMHEQDVIGSSRFSSCAAVILRERGETLFAHVRQSDPEVIRALLQAHPNADATLIVPYRVTDNESADRQLNERLAACAAERPGIAFATYPFIVSGMKNNPHRVNSTSVLVGKDFIRTVGVREHFSRRSGRQYFEMMDFVTIDGHAPSL